MLGGIAKALLIPSLAGAFLTVVLTLVRPVTKKYFGHSWHYYIWLAVLLVMLTPVQFQLPQGREPDVGMTPIQAVQSPQINEPVPEMPAEEQSDAPVPQATVLETGAERVRQFVNNRTGTLGAVWLAGAVLLLAIHLAGYIRLLFKIRRNSAIISCPEIAAYTDKNITVRAAKNLCSPFMMGIFRPVLVLPDRQITAEQLDNILRHEMTHFRRKDLLYKWFAVFVKCVHWFNPAVYYISRQIGIECEISCDLAVVSGMSQEEKRSYVTTILTLLSNDEAENIPLTTGMTGNKKMLKRRFNMIKMKKATSKLLSAISVIVAVAMLSTTVFASGVLSGWAEDNYVIEITNNGERIELSNKPFVENNTVYLPLREMLNLAGIANDTISYTNGYVQFFVDSKDPVEYRGEYYDFWINRILIGSKYAYIGGHSLGTTENAELLRKPMLINDITYAPFDLFEKLASQGIFQNLSVDVTSQTDIDTPLFGSLYSNDNMNFKIEIPLSWAGKYLVETDDNLVEFSQLATYNKYGNGSGGLFYIRRIPSSEAETEMNNGIGNKKIIWQDPRYTYIFGTPTDVQYPIWADRDEEDAAIADEYENMFGELNLIEASFSTIVKTSTIQLTNAENLSMDELQKLQANVNDGHYPWRLDPTETIFEFVNRQGIGGGEISAFAGDGLKGSATYSVDGKTYTLELIKPVVQSETGIWVIQSFYES